MEKIIGSGVRAERFTPVMVDAKEAPFIDQGKCVGSIYIHNIHDPDFEVF